MLSFHRKKQRIEKKEGLGFLFDVQGEINKKSVIYEIGQEMGNISWQFFFANGEAMAAASKRGLAAAAARGMGGGG